MISIGCENISLAFGEDIILDKISFSLNDGDKLGIVGVNGAGKSSLFKIITGEYTQTDGNVFVSKDKRIGLLRQNAIGDSDNTIYDEIMTAFSYVLQLEEQIEAANTELDGYEKSGKEIPASLVNKISHLNEKFSEYGGFEYKNRAGVFLKKLGFDEYMWNNPVMTLSGGQKTRIALGKLLLSRPDILMLDEPTNHLDIETMYWLEDYIKSLKCTVLVISHDRYFLDSTATKILDIENGKGTLYNGNYSTFTEKKQKDREIQERHYNNQQKEIARMEAFIEQQKRWNREKNIIAAESRQKAIDRMEKIDNVSQLPKKITLAFRQAKESGNDVLKVKGLSKSFGEKHLFSDVSFLIKKSDRAFIVGHNGSGKSTLMKILAGKLFQDKGSYEFGYNIEIGYYDQENQNLCDEKTVLDELWDSFPDFSQRDIRKTLAMFLFDSDDIQKTISVLSGGEKARLTLAKLILANYNVLILDEPTNHLDINSREAFESALEQFKGTIIAVSHDRYFIKKLSTRIIDISMSPIYDYNGTYEEYMSYKNNFLLKNASNDTEQAADSKTKQEYMQSKKEISEKRKKETKIKRTGEQIEKLEEEISRLDNKIEEFSSDYLKLSELCKEKEEKENTLLEMYELLDELLD